MFIFFYILFIFVDNLGALHFHFQQWPRAVHAKQPGAHWRLMIAFADASCSHFPWMVSPKKAFWLTITLFFHFHCISCWKQFTAQHQVLIALQLQHFASLRFNEQEFWASITRNQSYNHHITKSSKA